MSMLLGLMNAGYSRMMIGVTEVRMRGDGVG